jgi:hypothetical protein
MDLEVKGNIIVYARAKSNRHCFAGYANVGAIANILCKTLGNQLIYAFDWQRQIEITRF